jgi:hypothetical protein
MGGPRPMENPMATPDFIVENHAVLFLVKPQNEAAQKHLTDLAADASWYESALIVESRQIALLLMELKEAGWSVS